MSRLVWLADPHAAFVYTLDARLQSLETKNPYLFVRLPTQSPRLILKRSLRTEEVLLKQKSFFFGKFEKHGRSFANLEPPRVCHL